MSQPSDDLKVQTAKGGLSMAVATLGIRPISMIALIVLARLLDPADFGVVALAMVLFNTATLFSGLGMSGAVIQSPRDIEEIAFPAFVITVLASTLLFFVINMQIDLFARLLGNAEVAPLIRWMSLLIMINGLRIVPEALLQRRMMFGKVATAMVAANFTNYSVSVVLAFAGFGLWSLVAGVLVEAATLAALSWRFCPGWVWIIPHRLERQPISELLHYGVRSTAAGLVSFVNSNWDDWYIGRTLGATLLGYYNRAYAVTNGVIVGFASSVLNVVFMPSYARIQDDRARLSRVYLKALSMAALVMAPVSMGLFAVANELVPLVFGAKWTPMVASLQILCIMAFVRPMASSTSPLFRAVGKPIFDFRTGLVVLFTMVPLMLWLLPRYELVGGALAVTISYVIGFGFNIYQVNLILPGTGIKMVRAISPSTIASLLMVAAVALSRRVILATPLARSEVAVLAALIIVGGVVFLAAGYLLQRQLIQEVASLVLEIIQGDRGRKSVEQVTFEA